MCISIGCLGGGAVVSLTVSLPCLSRRALMISLSHCLSLLNRATAVMIPHTWFLGENEGGEGVGGERELLNRGTITRMQSSPSCPHHPFSASPSVLPPSLPHSLPLSLTLCLSPPTPSLPPSLPLAVDSRRSSSLLQKQKRLELLLVLSLLIPVTLL